MFLSDWVKSTDLHNIFRSLKHGTLVKTGIISESWLSKAIASEDTMKTAFPHLWAVLTLELWFHLYINHPIALHAPESSIKEVLLD